MLDVFNPNTTVTELGVHLCALAIGSDLILTCNRLIWAVRLGAVLSLNQGSIYWKIPPWGGGYQPMSFGGKNMKRKREKEGKCKTKMKKEERKGKKGDRK